jgi:hypothetical protein
MELLRRRSIRNLKMMVTLAIALATAGSAAADTFSMTGNWFSYTPSSTNPARDITITKLVEQTGTTLMIPADFWAATGDRHIALPLFPTIAQLTSTFNSTHAPMTFKAGSGAATSGTGPSGTINWCPQATGCAGFASGSVAPAFIGIVPGSKQFGGTSKIFRNSNLDVFRIVKQTPPISIRLDPNPVATFWTAGVTNKVTVMDINPPGKLYTGGSLTPTSGKVASLGAYAGPGLDPADGTGTGFRATTGTVFVSDATPSTTGGGPFSATISGSDNRTAGGNGQMTLVAGSVGYGSAANTQFFRTFIFTLNLPEPSTAGGLAAGAIAIVGLAHMRRRIR